MRKPRKAEPRLPAFESCVNCIGGWVMVWTTRSDWKTPRAVRCACWKAHQDRLTQMRAEAK